MNAQDLSELIAKFLTEKAHELKIYYSYKVIKIDGQYEVSISDSEQQLVARRYLEEDIAYKPIILKDTDSINILITRFIPGAK